MMEDILSQVVIVVIVISLLELWKSRKLLLAKEAIERERELEVVAPEQERATRRKERAARREARRQGKLRALIWFNETYGTNQARTT